MGDLSLIPRLGRSPWGGHGNPLQYSCLENPHGWRSVEGYSPWGRRESDTTEQLSTHTSIHHAAAPAAAKSLQSCPTLCNPIDGSSPGSPVPGILQARTLEWVAISFSNAWKWKVKGKLLSHVWLLATPWTAAYQALLSMGFSRQEYWSGVPLPSLSIHHTSLRIPHFGPTSSLLIEFVIIILLTFREKKNSPIDMNHTWSYTRVNMPIKM